MVRRKPPLNRWGKKRSFSLEALELRLALDGSGEAIRSALPSLDPYQLHVDPIPCLEAAPGEAARYCGLPDSRPGDDIHSNVPNDSATELKTSDDGFERVQSFLDSRHDVDAFSVVATGTQLHVSALLFFEPTTAVLSVLNADANAVVAQYTPADLDDGEDGFVPCECGDYGFIDLFPGLEISTEPGEMYYVTIEAGGGNVGRYILDVFDITTPPTPPVGNPDSQQGSDPHADLPGRQATNLSSLDDVIIVDSYIDQAGDADVFHLVATGNMITVSARSWTNQFQVAVDVLDVQGNVLGHNRLFNAANAASATVWRDPAYFIPSLPVETRPGGHYFVRVSSGPLIDGEYVLEIVQHPNPDLGFIGTPDSNEGEDLHANNIGADATPLSWDANRATIDTHIDYADDADVFAITPEFPRVEFSAFAVDPDLKLVLEVWDEHSHLLAISRFAESNVGLFDSFLNLSLDLHPTQTYYLRVRSNAGTTGEYVLATRQIPPDRVNPSEPIADARLGNDIHSDLVEDSATELVFDEAGRAVVYSHLDFPSDRDVFRMTGNGLLVHAIVANLGGLRGMVMNVYDESGVNLSLDRLDADPFGPDLAFHDWEGAADQTYYIEVLSTSNRIGTYFLEVTQAMSTAGVASVPGVDQAVAALPTVNDRNDAIGMLGDANFDGEVDATDFEIWQTYAFTSSGGPAHGDFNLDNVVDVSDFHIWFSNRFRSSSNIVNGSPASLPTREPRAAAAAAVALTLPRSTDVASPLVVTQAVHTTRNDRINTGQTREIAITTGNATSLAQQRVVRRQAASTFATTRLSAIAKTTSQNSSSRNMEWKDVSLDSAEPVAALQQLDQAFANWVDWD
jgi:hypothetical protein